MTPPKQSICPKCKSQCKLRKIDNSMSYDCQYCADLIEEYGINYMVEHFI